MLLNAFSWLLRPGRPLAALAVLALVAMTVGALSSPPPARSQGADVLLNVLATGAKKLNIVVPNFALLSGPDTSNLNYRAGDSVANFVIVEPDADGAVCVYTHAATHVVVDALGTVSSGFTGGAPQRLLDTRVANLPPGWP